MIANLPGYVKSRAQEGAETVAEYSLEVAETSVKSGIVISDALSDGSTVGAIAGTTGLIVAVGTRNPALGAASVAITSSALKLGTASDIASSVLKTADAVAFDGSYEAAYSQAVRTILRAGGSHIVQTIGGRVVARTGSSVSGPLFYNPASGRFVSNRVGLATSAAADATSVGISISADSRFDR